MNEVEEYYLQHFGVKGMKWGVRKSRNSSKSANKQAKKQAKKANKAVYKEAKKDIWAWSKATSYHNKNLAANVDREVARKRAASKDYDQAYGKAKKNYNRTVNTLRGVAIANMALSVALVTHPEAVYKGANVVGAVLGKGASKVAGSASTAGMYAKYAAKASVPVSRTVKNRGYIQAILVNSGNAVGFPG